MTKTNRLFFAVWPDFEVQTQIAKATQNALLGTHGRLVTAANMHITLRFLGKIDESLMACIERAAGQVVVSPFRITLNTLGCFRKSKVVWLGCNRQSSEITHLANTLSNQLLICGIVPESRSFEPHLSLLRNVRRAPAALIALGFPSFSWEVKEFVLVASKTFTQGVQYQILKRWSLT